jgi:Photosynthetic reaction centre cytochrome C subunit
MKSLLRFSLVAVCATSLLTLPALAQAPAGAAPSGAAPGAARTPPPPPSNLKVLPKDISRDDLIKIMRGFTGALGVECGYCHAQNPETKRTDFASDANPVKDKARVMIAMTDNINKTYLTQLASRKSTDNVSCGTCHRGMAVPEVFVPKPPAPRPPATPPPA